MRSLDIRLTSRQSYIAGSIPAGVIKNLIILMLFLKRSDINIRREIWDAHFSKATFAEDIALYSLFVGIEFFRF